jgi:hypothetical protein
MVVKLKCAVPDTSPISDTGYDFEDASHSIRFVVSNYATFDVSAALLITLLISH